MAGDTRGPTADTLPIDKYRPGDAAIEAPLPREVGADVRDTAPGRDMGLDVRDGARDLAPGQDGEGNEDGKLLADARDANAADAKDAPEKDAFVKLDTVPNKDTQPKDTNKDTSKDTKYIVAPETPPDSPPPSGCENPVIINTEVAHVDVLLSTADTSHRFDIPCVQGGNDVVLSFSIFNRELIYADTFGATWNTALSLHTTCPVTPMTGTPGEGMVWCNDDACGSKQSQIVAELPAGMYYLVVSGVGGESGSVTLHFQHAQVGDGPLTMVPAGAGTYNGTTNAEGLGSVDMCEGPGPDNSYWWATCPDYAGGTLTASTCEGTSFDTIVGLQVPRTNLSSCNDDSDSCPVKTRSSLKTTVPTGAGLNVVTVDGSTMASAGAYRLVLTRP